MPEQIRIFIDFWNFQLQWNDTVKNGEKINWFRLPDVFVDRATEVAGLSDYQYEGTRVYSSVDITKPKDRGLRNWLDNTLDRHPGINVYVRERSPKPKPAFCRECSNEISECPFCGKPIRRAIEKGVDSAIITDMFSFAWDRAYSTAILVTSDADFVPAVENLQNKGYKIINAAWNRIGNELSKKCWASFYIDDIIKLLAR